MHWKGEAKNGWNLDFFFFIFRSPLGTPGFLTISDFLTFLHFFNNEQFEEDRCETNFRY